MQCQDKEKYVPISFMNTNTKFVNKTKDVGTTDY